MKRLRKVCQNKYLTLIEVSKLCNVICFCYNFENAKDISSRIVILQYINLHSIKLIELNFNSRLLILYSTLF